MFTPEEFSTLFEYKIHPVRIQVKTLDNFFTKEEQEENGWTLPAYKNLFDGGADIRSVEDYILAPGEVKPIRTGLAVNIPPGWKFVPISRSGMSCKDIVVNNAPGMVDTNYLDEVMIILKNGSPEPFKINRGDRIAQVYIDRADKIDWDVVDEFSGEWLDNRGGGLGSTGVK